MEDTNMMNRIDPKTMYKALRALYPSSRRSQPVGITHNGQRVREVHCIWCDATETCCNDYPETQRVKDFRAKHNFECGKAIVRKYWDADAQVTNCYGGTVTGHAPVSMAGCPGGDARVP